MKYNKHGTKCKFYAMSNKGITLVALVVTIIVLLILAGVTIATISGNSSAPEKAAQARDSHERATELNDIQVAVTASIKETGYSPEVDITTLKQNISNLVTNNDLDTLITGDGPWIVTGKTGAKYQISNDGEAAWLSSKNIGDSVNYSTTRNGVTLDNWKVFYKEVKDGQEYTYLIYGDYLPYNAIGVGTGEGQISGLAKGDSGENGNDYCVQGTSTPNLLKAMITKSNWRDLLKGSLNGNSIDYTNLFDDYIFAIGSPTIEMWQLSWNINYPNTNTNTKNQLYIKEYNNGYAVSRDNVIPLSSEWSVNMSGTSGYNNMFRNSLYYPHTDIWNKCYGYWLASHSQATRYDVLYINYNGYIGYYSYNNTNRSFRPVICFPSSALE